MIKVLLNGTPIYKLCFSRKKYKTVGRKRPSLLQVKQAIIDAYGYNEGTTHKSEVLDAVEQLYGGKPLYETTALIYMIDAKRGEPAVAAATTRQSRLDDNRRETGREVALGRLLRTKDNPPFTAIERLAIRTAYDNRTKTDSKGKPPLPGTGSLPAQVREAATGNTHPIVNKVIPFVQRVASRLDI